MIPVSTENGHNRRKFLSGMIAAGIGGAMVLVQPRAATASPGIGDPRSYSDHDWDNMVGDTFYLCGSPFDESAGMAALVLRQVERGSHSTETTLPAGVSRRWCSLIFEVAGPDPVTSATHIVEHPELGRFPAFLNPRPDPRKPFANLCEIGFN